MSEHLILVKIDIMVKFIDCFFMTVMFVVITGSMLV